MVQAEPANMSKGAPGVVPLGHASPAKRSPAHDLWAVLIARACKVLPVAVPAVWWTDAPDRLHYRGHADQEVP